MDNLFIKEVVNGKLIEIERMTVGKMMQVGIACKDLPEHEKVIHLMCSITKVNGMALDAKEFLESDDFQVFNFISDSFNAMTNNNIM